MVIQISPTCEEIAAVDLWTSRFGDSRVAAKLSARTAGCATTTCCVPDSFNNVE